MDSWNLREEGISVKVWVGVMSHRRKRKAEKQTLSPA